MKRFLGVIILLVGVVLFIMPAISEELFSQSSESEKVAQVSQAGESTAGAAADSATTNETMIGGFLSEEDGIGLLLASGLCIILLVAVGIWRQAFP